jgi:1,4-dihydroxy-2-naphthoate polyprenyltransferase
MQKETETKIAKFFLATRPAFLTVSAAPVFIGSAYGFAEAGKFDAGMFLLALFGIMFLHSGANLANDYFDHISGNDTANRNLTPFSGGSRFIQEKILSARTILILSLSCLAMGAAIGLIILLITRSIFILILGLAGLVGGFFYTAPPFKLGYRSLGEIAIGFLFGILPVAGSNALQTQEVDLMVLLPGAIVGILIFLVILINEFPDRAADGAVNKRTLVVSFGAAAAVWIYRIMLGLSYVLAIAMLFCRKMEFAGLLYLLTIPVAAAAMRATNEEDLRKPGLFRANKLTIVLHLAGSIALTAGFIITGFCNMKIG